MIAIDHAGGSKARLSPALIMVSGSEPVFQSELNLPHIDGRAADGAERVRPNVPVRRTPDRMVEHVEGLQTELEGVTFAVRHDKLFVDRQINGLAVRRDHRIPPHIAEASGVRD